MDFYLASYSNQIMICVVAFAATVVMNAVKLVWPEWELFQTNLSMMLVLVGLGLEVKLLTRNTFAQGWFTYSEQTQMHMIFGIISGLTVWCVLQYTEWFALVGFDVDVLHLKCQAHLDKAFSFRPTQPQVPIEATYMAFAITAAMISYCGMGININFAHYFFSVNRVLEESEDSDNKVVMWLKVRNYLALIMPLLLLFTYVDELTYALLKEYLRVEHWYLLRSLLILLFALLRYSTFREEINF